MAFDLSKKLVIGVSTRALFDLSYENSIFETEGVEAYRDYQRAHEKEPLKPGPGFALIRSFLSLNELSERKDVVEVIIMSRNSSDTALRVFHSIDHYGLKIARAVLAGGAPIAPYLSAFHTDLFLSAHEDDVQAAIDSGIAAGVIRTDGRVDYDREEQGHKIRIAFDGDAVLFTDESERIYQEKGLTAFEQNEVQKADLPLQEGPFAKFLQAIAQIQDAFEGKEAPIRTALVTARCAPAHERAIKTLRSWGVRVDEAFFLGGVSKKEILKAFGADIFFDDQSIYTEAAAEVVFAARVPYKSTA
ncbi:MAG: 5'-nucleotidase [Lachnospiraceae bacterium]|nr:5'-nucleotidase [Lachnospiraceae bacterium]